MTLDVEVGMRTIGVPVVHAVTNDEVVARADFIDVACAVMRVLGARGALHLRAHKITGARFQALAEGLAAAAIDIAYVGLLSSALTFTMLTVALRYTPPSEAAVILSTETVFTFQGHQFR